MQTRRVKSASQAPSSTSASATAKASGTVNQKRKSSKSNALSAAKSASTAGSSNAFTTEQLALYNTMHAQLAAQKKAAAAAHDEGTSILV